MTTKTETTKPKKYPKGTHPNSHHGLSPGMAPYWPEGAKGKRTVYLSDEVWKGLKSLTKKYGTSVSEMMERVGRELLNRKAVKNEPLDVILGRSLGEDADTDDVMVFPWDILRDITGIPTFADFLGKVFAEEYPEGLPTPLGTLGTVPNRRKHTILLCTPTWRDLKDLAKYYEMTTSDLIERVSREILQYVPPGELESE